MFRPKTNLAINWLRAREKDVFISHEKSYGISHHVCNKEDCKTLFILTVHVSALRTVQKCTLLLVVFFTATHVGSPLYTEVCMHADNISGQIYMRGKCS